MQIRERRNWVNIGDDYILYDEHDKQIAKLARKSAYKAATRQASQRR